MIDIALVALFGLPCGSTARLVAVHAAVCTPVPSIVSPRDEYPVAGAPSTLQLSEPNPLGPVCALASTVTAWLTQTPVLGSLGVLSDTLTGWLSTFSVSE